MKVQKKRLSMWKIFREYEKRLSKAITTPMEEKSLKEIAWHREEKMKAKASMLCTGAKD